VNFFNKTPQEPKKWQKMQESFEAIRQNNPQYLSRAYLFLAYLYWKTGKKEKARYALKYSEKDKVFSYPECKALLLDLPFKNFIENN
jgi:hypothetical protein